MQNRKLLNSEAVEIDKDHMLPALPQHLNVGGSL